MSEFSNPFLRKIRLRTARIPCAAVAIRTSADSLDQATGVRRWLYLSLGIVCIGLAALGAVLPILPTTPFLILASSLFLRSNPAWHARLMRVPVWGSTLRDWSTYRAVRPRAKWSAVVLICLVTVISAWRGHFSGPLLIPLFGLSAIGLCVIYRLPVISNKSRTQTATQQSKAGPLERIGFRLNESHARRAQTPVPHCIVFDSQKIERLE